MFVIENENKEYLVTSDPKYPAMGYAYFSAQEATTWENEIDADNLRIHLISAMSLRTAEVIHVDDIESGYIAYKDTNKIKIVKEVVPEIIHTNERKLPTLDEVPQRLLDLENFVAKNNTQSWRGTAYT